jgi:predicted nucleotide-binding protein
MPRKEGRIFIGHGRSNEWKKLQRFIKSTLKLKPDEFNRKPVAGRTAKGRLQEMLADACFAFLVMTADDEHADRSKHARENVIHEIGLFQGHLGFKRAIVLLEEGCKEFSNIIGITQIRFPSNNIEMAFKKVRAVLKREGIINKK